MENKRRKDDNAKKRLINPNWIVAAIIIAGYVIMFASNVVTIPELKKKVEKSANDIITLQANYKWIKDGITELKVLIKEK